MKSVGNSERFGKIHDYQGLQLSLQVALQELQIKIEWKQNEANCYLKLQIQFVLLNP